MTLRKYLILLAVAVFAASGDVCLARGMRDFGAVTSSNWKLLVPSLLNPWIIGGIALLVMFFCCYLAALSWADLTYVIPATAVSYILMAVLARIFLHENVTPAHWLGIGLIVVGVGVVASGAELTTQPHQPRHGHRTIVDSRARSES